MATIGESGSARDRAEEDAQTARGEGLEGGVDLDDQEADEAAKEAATSVRVWQEPSSGRWIVAYCEDGVNPEVADFATKGEAAGLVLRLQGVALPDAPDTTLNVAGLPMTAGYRSVWVVNRLEEPDGLLAFDEEEQAREFHRLHGGERAAIVVTEEPIMDRVRGEAFLREERIELGEESPSPG
jgi:hypothetical protein